MIDPPPIWIGNQTAFSATPLTLPFEYALANGFDAFEWFPDKKPDGTGWGESDLDPLQRLAIRDAARARGLRLSVHARHDANPLGAEARASLMEDIQLARDLGAALLNIHLQTEAEIPAFVDAIRWLIVATADVRIQLSIENTPATTPAHFNELFARLQERDFLPAGAVGMCLDLGHANLCPTTRNDFLAYVDQLDPRVPIIHLHVHENWGDADSHLPLFTGPAGRDPSGVRGLLDRLRQRRFSGSLILEQWPHPPSLLNTARDRLLEFWREVAGAPTSAQRGLPVRPVQPMSVSPAADNSIPLRAAPPATHGALTPKPAPS